MDSKKQRQQRILAVMSTGKPSASNTVFAIAGFCLFFEKSGKPLQYKYLRHVGKSVENVDN